jgi:hypothetical protein
MYAYINPAHNNLANNEQDIYFSGIGQCQSARSTLAKVGILTLTYFFNIYLLGHVS